MEKSVCLNFFLELFFMGNYSNIPYSPVDQKLPLFDANLTCRCIHSMFIFRVMQLILHFHGKQRILYLIFFQIMVTSRHIYLNNSTSSRLIFPNLVSCYFKCLSRALFCFIAIKFCQNISDKSSKQRQVSVNFLLCRDRHQIESQIRFHRAQCE